MNLKRADSFAEEAHFGQVRKSTGKPYIEHPRLVAKLLAKANMPVYVIVAGFLHDVVEDTPVTIEEILAIFGEKTASLVAFNTEDKDLSWEERKTHTIQALLEASTYEKHLVVADKFANLMELAEDEKTLGDEIWKSFKRGKEQQRWYFTGVYENSVANLEAHEIPDLFKEYKNLLDAFFV
jgi:(p)ppGpp synthase/HD superfamily hydrolase